MQKVVGKNQTSTLILHNGRTVHLEFLNIIREAVEERIPSLAKHTNLTLKKICGEDFWCLLGEGEKRMAGWYMEHLVAMNELPLIYAGKDSNNAKQYQLV